MTHVVVGFEHCVAEIEMLEDVPCRQESLEGTRKKSVRTSDAILTPSERRWQRRTSGPAIGKGDAAPRHPTDRGVRDRDVGSPCDVDTRRALNDLPDVLDGAVAHDASAREGHGAEASRALLRADDRDARLARSVDKTPVDPHLFRNRSLSLDPGLRSLLSCSILGVLTLVAAWLMKTALPCTRSKVRFVTLQLTTPSIHSAPRRLMLMSPRSGASKSSR